MPPSPQSLALQPLLALWLLLIVGLAYAAWFRHLRAAWGFGILAWTTAAGLSGRGWEVLGYGHADRLAALTWQFLPINLLFLAVLPPIALRGRGGLALALFFAFQLAVAAWLAGSLDSVPRLDQQLLGLLPPAVAVWLEPPGPLLVLVAAIALFARWQRTDDFTELALFLAVTLLLVALLAPQQAPTAVAAGGLGLLASQVVLAHRMAFVDALTGLNNRRALESALVALPARYAIAMVDIDHFKSINDRFGHDVGDQVLRMTAARLRGSGGYHAYRFGGEEFCLLFKGRRVAEARALCERAREAIADPPMVIRSAARPDRKPRSKKKHREDTAGIQVTASFGLAFPQGGAGPKETIEAADRALYRAKRGGRNRVNVAGKPRG